MVRCDRNIYCNVCGERLEAIPEANTLKEHLSIKKEWGYFSGKDFKVHSFDVCETCYDKWVDTFAIPIKEKTQTEWAGTLPEEAFYPIAKESRY